MGKDKKVIDLYGSRQKSNVKQDTYAKALEELVSPFINRFPEEYFVEEVYEFAISVWNSYNLNKHMPSDEESLVEQGLMTEPEKSIFEGMMYCKKEKFDNLEYFIMDFEIIPLGKNEIRLTVSTADKDGFLQSFFESEAEILQDVFEAEEGYVNRGALILIPKKPFFDWINSHDDDGENITAEEPYVYLVDEEIEDWKVWLPKAYKSFFEEILFERYIDEDYWPKKRTYTLFKDWFTVLFSEMVWDSVPEPLHKDF